MDPVAFKKKLGINSTKVLEKSSELLRLLKVRCPTNMGVVNIS